MRAVVMRGFGGEDVLELEEVQAPEAGPGEVLVRVAAVEVARTRDVATRSGTHPFSRQVTLPHVLGGDFAGTVLEVGAGVDSELAGRRVAVACSVACGVCARCAAGHDAQCSRLAMVGVHRWGSYAELVAVPAENVHPIADDLGMVEAAALAAAGPIAFTQLRTGGVTAGTWALVTGATGSLGTTLLALATHAGARVVGLGRRPDAIPAQLARDGRLDATGDELTEQLLELSEGEGFATAVDNVGDPRVFGRYFAALAAGGRVVVSGALGDGGRPVLTVPVGLLYLKSLSIVGVRTAGPADARRFWQLVDDGFRLPPGLVHEVPLEQAASAHAHVAGGSQVGHTVLTVPA